MNTSARSEYESSGFDRVMCMVLMWIAIIPGMLMVCSTAYPLFDDMPQMTTISVATKRCFWMCVVSLLSSVVMLTMYVNKSFQARRLTLINRELNKGINPDEVDDAGFEVELK